MSQPPTANLIPNTEQQIYNNNTKDAACEAADLWTAVRAGCIS